VETNEMLFEYMHIINIWKGSKCDIDMTYKS